MSRESPTSLDSNQDPLRRDFSETQALLRRAYLPPMPVGFAARMQSQVDDLQEKPEVENGLVGLLGVAMTVGGVVMAAPQLLQVVQSQWAAIGGSLPMALAASAALAAAWFVDRAWSQDRQDALS